MIAPGARPVALAAYLSTLRSRAVKPGVFDCALFVADWVLICTGTDLAADHRGRYSSYAGGRRRLRRDGHGGMAALAEARMRRLDGWAFAVTGDVALLSDRGREAAGIVANGNIHVLAPDIGLDHVPLSRAIAVFRP